MVGDYIGFPRISLDRETLGKPKGIPRDTGLKTLNSTTGIMRKLRSKPSGSLCLTLSCSDLYQFKL